MPQKKIFQLIALTFFLSGCSYNPFSSDNHLTGKPVGAAIGATAGAGTAALAGASRTMVAVTGVGGAAVGYYVTTLGFEAGGVKAAGGEVFAEGNCVTINIPADSLFDSNTATLLPEATPILNSAVNVLMDFPDNNVVVSGNSSGFGTHKHELRLTRQRAREVAGYLWAHGVSAFQSDGMRQRHLLVAGYGHRFPAANDIQAKSIRENSRIQISSCPTAADLKTTITDVTDANVGRLGEQNSPPAATPVTDSDFKADHLPVTQEDSTENFHPAIQDTSGTPRTSSTDLKYEKYKM